MELNKKLNVLQKFIKTSIVQQINKTLQNSCKELKAVVLVWKHNYVSNT